MRRGLETMRKTDEERIEECLMCDYLDECAETIQDPEEYEDGSCKQKEIFKADVRHNN